MLFMTIFTYEPDKRDEVVKRALTKGTMVPEGAMDLGQWSSTSGGKVFRLVEMDDPLVAYKGTYAWSDLGKVEVYPVIDTQELLRRLAEM
jgi:hypothetical protein